MRARKRPTVPQSTLALVRTASVPTLLTIAGAVANVGCAAAVARRFGVETFAEYASGTAAGALAFVLVGLGTSAVVARDIASGTRPQQAVLAQATTLRILGFILTSFVVLALTGRSAFGFFVVNVLANGFVDLAAAAWRGLGRFTRGAMVVVVYRVAQLAVVLIVPSGIGAPGLAFAMVVTTVGVGLIGLLHIRADLRAVARPDWRAIRQLAVRGAPLAAASLAEGTVTRVDVVMVRFFGSVLQTAQFSAITTVAVGVGSALYTLAHVTLRVLSEVSPDRLMAVYRQLLMQTWLIAMAVGLVLVGAFPVLVRAVFGAAVGGDVPWTPFVVFMAALPAVIGSRVSVMALIALDRRRDVLAAQVAAAVSVLVGVSIGFVAAGLAGAAAGSVIGDCVLFAVSHHLVRRAVAGLGTGADDVG